jgi:tetratricopeptide (TPR) repeat protein/DNA-binding SARP family transcriptional activator
MWEIQILGGFEVKAPNGRGFTTKSADTRELLGVLSIAGPSGLMRRLAIDELVSEAWADPKAGLRNTLSRLRRGMEAVGGSAPIKSSHQAIQLEPGECSCDLWTFENWLSEWSVSGNRVTEKRLLKLIAGISFPLFGSLTSELANEYRNDYYQKLLILLWQLTSGTIDEEKCFTIIQAAKQIQKHNQYSTNLVRHLARIYGALGYEQEITELITQYDSWLDNEYGESVSKDIESIVEKYTKLHRRELISKGPGLTAPITPMIGRESELSYLVTKLQKGAGKTLLTGPPGVGKSKLAQEAVKELTRKGVSCLVVDFQLEHVFELCEQWIGQDLEVLVLDHFEEAANQDIEYIVRAFAASSVLYCGNATLSIHYSEVITLRGLNTLDSTGLHLGPGARLMTEFFDYYCPIQSRFVISASDLFQLVELCGGQPLAMRSTAEFVVSYGVTPVLSTLTNKYDESIKGLTPFHPLLAIFEMALYRLSSEALSVYKIISTLGCWVPVPLLNEIVSLSPLLFAELVNSGLLDFDKAVNCIRPSFRLPGSVSCVNSAYSDKDVLVKAYETVFAKVCSGTVQVPREDPNFAYFLTISKLAALSLIAGDLVVGWKLFSFVYHPRVPDELLPVETSILYESFMDDDLLISFARLQVLGGISLIKGDCHSLLSALEKFTAKWRLDVLGDELACQVLSLTGLAHRSGDLAAAASCFEHALALSEGKTSTATRLKVLYNASVIFVEADQDARRAIESIDAACELIEYAPSSAAKCELRSMQIAARLHSHFDAIAILNAIAALIQFMEREKVSSCRPEIYQNCSSSLYLAGEFRMAAFFAALSSASRLTFKLSQTAVRGMTETVFVLGDSMRAMNYIGPAQQCFEYGLRLLRQSTHALPRPGKLALESLGHEFGLNLSPAATSAPTGPELRSLISGCLQVADLQAVSLTEALEWLRDFLQQACSNDGSVTTVI